MARNRQSNKDQMAEFVARLNDAVMDVTGPKEMKDIGAFIVGKIFVRTGVGFGVKENYGDRYALKTVRRTAEYEKFRKWFKGKGLSGNTEPSKHNLTLTGDMLNSLSVKEIGKNSIRIGVSGFDRFGTSNQKKAEYQERLGRTFLRLSMSEVKDVRREWLKQISGLLKDKKLV